MTDAELDRIEATLSLKLPRKYREMMREFPEDLRDWPPAPGEASNRQIEDFLLNVDEIFEAQKGARRRLRRALPKHSFVFGRSGENYWLIKTNVEDSPVTLVFDEMLLDGRDDLAEHLERTRKDHAEAWKKAGRRSTAGGSADITADALIAEGRRLARPALRLVEEGEEYAGFWSGTGAAPPPDGEWKHVLSFESGLLPQNPRGLSGVISIYLCIEDNERFEEVRAVHDAAAKLPSEPGGQLLYAERFDCLPPIEALFRLGGPQIQDWLAANSIEPGGGFNPRAFGEQSRAALKAYDRLLQEEHPFSANDGTYAMLGGWSWPFLWCYGMDEGYPWDLYQKALVVLTIADSEPWLEVFDDGAEFVSFSRIT